MKHTQHTQHVRGLYHKLLSQSIELTAFYERIAILLDLDPYFFPAYRELLWRAEELHDPEGYRVVLRSAFNRAIPILTQSPLREDLSLRWTNEEIDALVELLERVAREPSATFVQKNLSRIIRAALDELIVPKTRTSPREPHHLKHIETIDPASLKQEIDALAPFWWYLHTSRTLNITHHQHTRAIVLRTLIESSETYAPHDDVHESKRVPYANLLPKTHDTVLAFAREHQLGLGRVAIVRMKPGAQAYRHYDSEPYLRGRKRYHLIVDCGDGNLLSSGPETVEVRQGEIWFFDNQTMHRAYNGANKLRTHVIFDGYPLEG